MGYTNLATIDRKHLIGIITAHENRLSLVGARKGTEPQEAQKATLGHLKWLDRVEVVRFPHRRSRSREEWRRCPVPTPEYDQVAAGYQKDAVDCRQQEQGPLATPFPGSSSGQSLEDAPEPRRFLSPLRVVNGFREAVPAT